MTLLECVTPDVLAARQRFQGGVVATHATTTAAATTTNIPPAVVPVAETESIPTTSRAKTKSDSSTGSAAVRVKTESSSSRDVKSSVSNGRVKPETIPRVKSEAPARVKVEVKAKPEPRPVEVPVPMDTSGSADVKGKKDLSVSGPWLFARHCPGKGLVINPPDLVCFPDHATHARHNFKRNLSLDIGLAAARPAAPALCLLSHTLCSRACPLFKLGISTCYLPRLFCRWLARTFRPGHM